MSVENMNLFRPSGLKYGIFIGDTWSLKCLTQEVLSRFRDTAIIKKYLSFDFLFHLGELDSDGELYDNQCIVWCKRKENDDNQINAKLLILRKEQFKLSNHKEQLIEFFIALGFSNVNIELDTNFSNAEKKYLEEFPNDYKLCVYPLEQSNYDKFYNFISNSNTIPNDYIHLNNLYDYYTILELVTMHKIDNNFIKGRTNAYALIISNQNPNELEVHLMLDNNCEYLEIETFIEKVKDIYKLLGLHKLKFNLIGSEWIKEEQHEFIVEF